MKELKLGPFHILVSAQDTYKVSDLQVWSPWCWGNWVLAQRWGTVGRALTELIKPSAERAIREVDINLFCDFSFLPWSSLLVAVSLRGVQPKYKAYYQPNFCIMMCFLAAPVNKLFYQSLWSTYRHYQGILKPFFFFFSSVIVCCTPLIHLFVLNLWRLVPSQLLAADSPAVSCVCSECTGQHFCFAAHASVEIPHSSFMVQSYLCSGEPFPVFQVGTGGRYCYAC